MGNAEVEAEATNLSHVPTINDPHRLLPPFWCLVNRACASGKGAAFIVRHFHIAYQAASCRALREKRAAWGATAPIRAL